MFRDVSARLIKTEQGIQCPYSLSFIHMRPKADSPRVRMLRKTQDSPRHRRKSFGILRHWCACALLILLTFCVVTYRTTTKSRSSNAIDLEREVGAVTAATNFTDVPGVGFVMLGLGPFARQLKCPAAVESLRTHGGWSGAVYIITDAPDCLTKDPDWTECGLDAHVVDVKDDLSSGFTMPSFYKTRGNRLKSKKYKTSIFELIQDPAIEVLIYMDCDILVGMGPEELETFIRSYKDRFNEDRRLYLFPENNPGKLNGVVHTGLFMAHRAWSASLLERWRTQLDTEIDASDQAAFVRAGIDEYAFLDEHRYLYRPRCDRDDCSALKPLLFNHINGARCWSQGKADIQRFVDRWELCTYRHHNYCFPWYMTQFAMSWIPYRSCTKMEDKKSKK